MFFKIQTWYLEHRREVILGVCIVLISTISFALGYLVKGEQEKASIIIEKAHL